MRILCTFPGRYGDLLWALPTVRAISEAAEEPVDLVIGGEFAGLRPLLLLQPYVRSVWADAVWTLQPPAEWWYPHAETLASAQDARRIVHLGYRGWPDQPLAQYVYAQTQREYPDLPLAPLDLDHPWITVPPLRPAYWVEGWTEAWFELKFGVSECLYRRFGLDLEKGMAAWGMINNAPLHVSTGARWRQEARVQGCDWLTAARWITGTKLFVGDCSALHVLAVACGTPVLCLEPMEARHNNIFYPLGKTGRVKLILGNDGQPTHDARHLGDAIEEALRGY